jgi:hypothetical protein
MKRFGVILILLAVALAMSSDAKSRNKPRSRDGDYKISIAGYFKGEGSGTIAGNQIKLQLSVVTADGSKGTLVAPSIRLTGTHFTGAGMFNGQSLMLTGRVDAPDNDLEKSIKGVRLVSLVKTGDGRYSRLIGYIPALAADPDEDPSNHGRGRNK